MKMHIDKHPQLKDPNWWSFFGSYIWYKLTHLGDKTNPFDVQPKSKKEDINGNV